MNQSEIETENGTSLNIGSLVCSGLFILIGAVCYYETTKMSDPDSFVFPRMVIVGLIGLSLVHILNSFIRPGETIEDETQEDEDTTLSTPRRVLLVVTMAGSALLMPVIGFLLSGVGAFIALMLLSQYDSWTKKNLWLSIIIAVFIVFGFYWCFTNLLHVPLPEGSLIKFP